MVKKNLLEVLDTLPEAVQIEVVADVLLVHLL
jgi:hypothetical protein